MLRRLTEIRQVTCEVPRSACHSSHEETSEPISGVVHHGNHAARHKKAASFSPSELGRIFEKPSQGAATEERGLTGREGAPGTATCCDNLEIDSTRTTTMQ